MRVLIVEDDEDVAELLECALARRYQVTTARTAVVALRLLARAPVDVIVTDLSMPAMTGEDFAAECARRGHVAPVVAMSADFERLQRAAFAVAWLRKPFVISELVQAIDRAVVSMAPRAGGFVAGASSVE